MRFMRPLGELAAVAPVPSTQHAAKAEVMADRLPAGEQRTIHNAELRVIFGVSRITAHQREEIVRAIEQAGLEVLSGRTAQPLVVRNPATQSRRATAVTATEKPWFKRKRTWAIAAVLLFVLVAALGSEPDSSDKRTAPLADDTTTHAAPATSTDTTPTTAGPTRADLDGMVKADRYADALAAAAQLGSDDESYVTRRIANRLARRTMAALTRGDRSRARFLVLRSEDYPSTSLSRQARGAYRRARVRADARFCSSSEKVAYRDTAAIKPGCADYAADRQAAVVAREQREAAEAAPVVEAPSTDPADTSGPSTTNWCGKRDGDGDGIYCEGE